MLFVKNRGKQLDGFNGNGNGSTHKDVESAKDVSKPFDRQSTITRLAVLNTATEILKTHGKPIEFNDIVSLASRLEAWVNRRIPGEPVASPLFTTTILLAYIIISIMEYFISYRNLSREVGIKTLSIHYYFPTRVYKMVEIFRILVCNG